MRRYCETCGVAVDLHDGDQPMGCGPAVRRAQVRSSVNYYGDNFEENVLARHRREEAAEESGHCSHWPLHQCCFCDEREDKSYAGLIRHIAAQEAELERRHNLIAELFETNSRLEAHLNGCPYNGMECGGYE